MYKGSSSGPPVRFLRPEECSLIASTAQLIEIASLVPPAEPFDWTVVETRIGAPVPPDYRELVDAGGGGLWLDYLRIWVPHPGPRYKHVDLAESGAEFDQLMEMFEDDVVAPPDDLVPGCRLLPWADAGSGHTAYWEVTEGAAPESYPIRVSDREGTLWARYELPTTDFLLGLVRGELHAEPLNASWMDREAVFRRYQPREM
ncbi:hypothetical protein [Nocardia carnea]|uniref:hypothetical protein n=1 Tax=Nocardia carnea TaxID=37328 RepID=UPI002456788B|nr:hypothetical protein [Nocardia carnea]